MTTFEAVDRPAVHLRADGRRAQFAVVIMLLIVAVAAFVAAIPGLLWAGQVAGLGVLAWAVPIVVDGGQIVAALATAVRHSTGRSATWESATLAGLVLLSAASQTLHAWLLAPADQVLPATVMACTLAAAMPLTVLATTHAATRAVLAPPSRRKAAKRAPAVTVAPAPTMTTSASPAPRVTTPKPAQARTVMPATMSVDEAVHAVLHRGLSQRDASKATGATRYKIASAVAVARAAQAETASAVTA
ncbi:hypothetical protein LG299_12560 [Microbacterium lacus]|uniref:hypothetical protein n=1 Tax=Microbacterium lacus TaxID=415217 RepID=UPI00384D769B